MAILRKYQTGGNPQMMMQNQMQRQQQMMGQMPMRQTGGEMQFMNGQYQNGQYLNGLNATSGMQQPISTPTMQNVPTSGGSGGFGNFAQSGGLAAANALGGLATELGGNAIQSSGESDLSNAANAPEIAPGVKQVNEEDIRSGYKKQAVGSGLKTGSQLGATIGGIAGSLIPIPGLGTAAGMALGTGLGTLFGGGAGAGLGALFGGKKKGDEAVEQANEEANLNVAANQRAQDAKRAASLQRGKAGMKFSKFNFIIDEYKGK